MRGCAHHPYNLGQLTTGMDMHAACKVAVSRSMRALWTLCFVVDTHAAVAVSRTVFCYLHCWLKEGRVVWAR